MSKMNWGRVAAETRIKAQGAESVYDDWVVSPKSTKRKKRKKRKKNKKTKGKGLTALAEPLSRVMVQCPQCGRQVREARLPTHLFAVHRKPRLVRRPR